MNTPSPLTPQGTTPETRRRHMTAFFVILSLHVLVLGMFLMVQGCKPETEPPKPTADAGEPGLVSETTPPAGGNPSTLGDPLPNNTGANPVGAPGAVTPPPAGVPAGAAPLGGDPALSGGVSPTPGVGTPVGGAGPGVIPAPTAPLTPTPLPPPVAVEPTPVTTPGSEHTVLKGETLAVIAKQYHMGWKAIAAANPGVDPTKLKVGQKLVIPARTVTAASDAGAISGGGFAPAAGVEAPAPTKTYTVKSGDNLARIAKTHGVTLKALKAANGLKLDRITVGQKLKIPAKPGAAPSVPSTPVPPPSTPVVPEPVPTIPAPPATTTPGALVPPVLPPPPGGAPVRNP